MDHASHTPHADTATGPSPILAVECAHTLAAPLSALPLGPHAAHHHPRSLRRLHRAGSRAARPWDSRQTGRRHARHVVPFSVGQMSVSVNTALVACQRQNGCSPARAARWGGRVVLRERPWWWALIMTSAICCPLVSGWSHDVHRPFPQRFQSGPAPPRGLHNSPLCAGGRRGIGAVQSCNAWCAWRHAPWHGRCPSPRERRSPPQEQAHLADRHRHVPDSEQHWHRTRWHGLPVPRRDGSLVMDHQLLTRAFGRIPLSCG
jgi:hypothetical protein